MYLGGTTAQGQATGIALDSQGNVTILGQTYATDFPTTADAYQPALNGTGSHYDFTLAKLHADGKTLEYSTYFGGTSDDYSRDLAIDSSGINTYFTGHGSSYDFPVTGGSWDTTSISDVHNVYVVRFTMGACFTGTPLRGHVPDRVTFTNTTTNNPYLWQWNFGDGTTPVNATSPNPVHTYTGSGSFNVSLTATNLIMGVPTTTTLIRNNYIIIPPPVANFTSNLSTGTAPLSVQFDDTSTDVLTWNWSFGDGNISSLENPVYTYHTSGNYTVNLTANNTNSHGTKIEYINVSAVPPTPTPTLTPTPIITQHHGTPYNGGGQTGGNTQNGYTGPQPASQGGVPAKPAVVQQNAPLENTPAPIVTVTALAPVQNPSILAMVILTLQEYQFWLILAVIIIILVAILRRWWIR